MILKFPSSASRRVSRAEGEGEAVMAVTTKIRKLRALARSPNKHEAASALAKAFGKA